MKFEQKLLLSLIFAISSSAAWAAGQFGSFGAVEGRYLTKHAVSSFSKGETRVFDTLQLSHELGKYSIALTLHFDYDVKCELEGSTSLSESGSKTVLTYTDEDACSLQLLVDDTEITVSDPEHSCASYCGMGGTFDGASFSRAGRLPLQ
ncbi:MAG: hypothetical protein DI582_00755 [Azospirillum brasilense]|nr:MAG: hypothetical protein DI582_00755 [Azospirillum brasilense]